MRPTHLDVAPPHPPFPCLAPPNRKLEERLVDKQRQKAPPPPFSASYLTVPHSFLYPILPPSPLLSYNHSPLIAGFVCFFQHLRRRVFVMQGYPDGKVEGRMGVTNWKEEIKRTLWSRGGGVPQQKCRQSTSLPSLGHLLFLSAWIPVGFAATHSFYRPCPLCI